MVCQNRTLTLALQQISEIAALRTEQDKVEMRKRDGLKESKNPMLSVRVRADLYRLGEFTNFDVLLCLFFTFKELTIGSVAHNCTWRMQVFAPEHYVSTLSKAERGSTCTSESFQYVWIQSEDVRKCLPSLQIICWKGL